MSSESPEPKRYRIAIRRPVTMVMLFMTLIVFGWRSYQRLPINLMPDISYPTLTVRTEYEGAAPEDVEKLVTRPLEEMLSVVGGMVEISSISSPGLSEIVLEFTWDTDMNVAQQDVRDRLDLFDPPREVTEKPVILRYDPTLDPVMRVAITAPEELAARGPDDFSAALTAIRDAAERYVKSDLEAEIGIAQVAVKGGREPEIQVLVDAARLKNLGLTLDYLVSSLAQQNINLSGGSLKEGKTEYLVRTLNEFQTVGEIAESLVTTPGGRTIPLYEVAQVFEGTKERETIVHIDGREAVALDIFKEGDANTVEVCNKVKDLLGFERKRSLGELMSELIAAQMRSMQTGAGKGEGFDLAQLARQRRTLLNQLPEASKLSLISDQSRFIIGAIDEVKSALLVGGALALMVLFVFLREFKSTTIIGLSIPISVIAAFVPMFMRDITLNIMSLGGLALGVGMLVDNAIVVLESIFRCKEEGDGSVDAAERGTKEVANAVTASTLTTVCVFFPIAFVEGIEGQLFSDLALTVTFSLLASLLTALYLIPLLASMRAPDLGGASGVQAVWLAHAFTISRDAGRSRLAALLRIPVVGMGLAMQSCRDSARAAFGPAWGVVRRTMASSRLWIGLVAMLVLLLFPLLAVLYLCQIAAKLAGALLATALFLVAALCWVCIRVCRLAIAGTLWVPLSLFEVAFSSFRQAYGVMLNYTLSFAPIILLALIGLAVHAGYTALSLGTELIPPMNQGEFGIRFEARAGTRLEETEERVRRIEAMLREVPEIASVTVEIGQERSQGGEDRGENVGVFTVNLLDPEENAAMQDEIMERLRTALQHLVTEDEEITFTLPSLFSFKTAVELQVVGSDLAELRRVGERTLEAVRGVPGLRDPELSVKPGYPEIIIELDRELLASKGIPLGQVASRLRTEVQGEVATRFSRAGEKVDVRVRTDRALLQSVEDLRLLSVTAGGAPVPLEEVATIRVEEGPSQIRRIGQRQVVLITANVEGRDLGAVAREMSDALRDVQRPSDYEFVMGGQVRELGTSYESLRFALLLAIFLVYVVMACQFESVLHPALVMFSVPLAFVGVIYVLVWCDMDLSIMVFLGGIVLAGIVVNNAIVLVDYINQLRARGYDKRRAIIEAGQVRLRPILMTTVTTVLGLLPMVTAAGEGAEMRRPMAITVVAGLTSATVLTLLVIPMVYYLFGGRDRAVDPAEPAQ